MLQFRLEFRAFEKGHVSAPAARHGPCAAACRSWRQPERAVILRFLNISASSSIPAVIFALALSCGIYALLIYVCTNAGKAKIKPRSKHSLAGNNILRRNNGFWETVIPS
jgi:hypothetical protein